MFETTKSIKHPRQKNNGKYKVGGTIPSLPLGKRSGQNRFGSGSVHYDDSK